MIVNKYVLDGNYGEYMHLSIQILLYEPLNMLLNNLQLLIVFLSMLVIIFLSLRKIIVLKKKLNDLSKIDFKTNLFSREMYSKTLKSIIKENTLYKYSFIQFYIDDFNKLLTLYGFSTGDMIIKNIAKKANEIFYKSKIFTFHSTNFIVIIENTNKENLSELIKRFYEDIDRNFYINKQKITLSISTAIYIPGKKKSTEQEIEQILTSTLLDLQEKGKNQYGFYLPQNLESMRRYNLIEKKLEELLKDPYQEDLYVVFQKQNDLLYNDHIVGFEALSRLKIKDYGEIKPKEFIKIAEDSDLISKLGKFVLKRACEFYQEMLKANLTPVPISINVSTNELLNEDFIIQLRKTLDFYKVDQKYIKLELTESVFSDSQEEVNKVIKDLKAFGVYASLDDFGTGYSSLSYLRKSEFEFIKIDRSFITNIQLSDENQKLLRTIIQIADILEFKVIVEGVEIMDELKVLKNLGVHYAQGFYFGKPLKIDDALSELSIDEIKPYKFL